jgi:hypothetical protein
VNQIKSKLHAAVIDMIQALNENPTGEVGATREDN